MKQEIGIEGDARACERLQVYLGSPSGLKEALQLLS